VAGDDPLGALEHGKIELRLNGKKLKSDFHTLKTDRCPFEAGTSSEFSRPELSRCSRLKPQLVGQIKFAEWTQDGKLRQTVFLGLRDDKDARDVVREAP
jgi:bifunctional non-homologous end joining protein LigD